MTLKEYLEAQINAHIETAIEILEAEKIEPKEEYLSGEEFPPFLITRLEEVVAYTTNIGGMHTLGLLKEQVDRQENEENEQKEEVPGESDA